MGRKEPRNKTSSGTDALPLDPNYSAATLSPSPGIITDASAAGPSGPNPRLSRPGPNPHFTPNATEPKPETETHPPRGHQTLPRTLVLM